MIKTFLPYIFLLFFVGCSPKKNDEKLADARLQRIEKLVNENALHAAKIEIDSIHLLHPRMVAKRRIAQAFMDTIVIRESKRTLLYCDSILPLKLQEAETLLKNFRFEKNEKYQDVGNYVYKTQITEQNATRSYLKAYTDDNADFHLISYHTGAKIEHTSVTVAVGNRFATTDTIPLNNPLNYRFSDGDSYWESLTFKNEAAMPVAALISEQERATVRVSLSGNRNTAYILNAADKKAIAETYHLWIVLRDIKQLNAELQKAQARLERLGR